MDKISPADRRRNMQRIKSKNTAPEIKLRKILFAKGFRYRLHVNNLPGKPDIVFNKRKIALFVNGCFWHSHNSKICHKGHLPKSNQEFWSKKLGNNTLRDLKNYAALQALGWKVIIVWECEIESIRIDPLQLIKKLD
jgi:DNA mismatch endonuclease, patch repair protein